MKRKPEEEIELEGESQDKSRATENDQGVESQGAQAIPEVEESLFVKEVPDGIVDVDAP